MFCGIKVFLEVFISNWMAKKDFDEKGLSPEQIFAIKAFARDLKANKYVSGEMQFTDITNCDYFLKAYGDTIRYCSKWDKFLLWNGTCWEIDGEDMVSTMYRDFIHQLYRVLRVINDVNLQYAFEKHLMKSENFRRIIAVLGIMKMTESIRIKSDEMDLDNYLFNTEKLTIKLKTGECQTPDKEDRITKKSKFIYDKNAKCPTWEMFLMQIFNNDLDLIHFVQKAVGYSLSGDTSEQCLFILWGNGANGKSTFLNVLQHLFGDYASTARTETFMKKTSEQSNDLARLKGARIVTTSEAEQGKPLSESLIKQITGGDKLSARFLYGEFFDFIPTFKIFMATNHKPKIKGGDNGIWRRIKMIPFTVTIPPEKRDKHLTEKLIAENSGILNWILEGYAMWEKEGLLNEPKAVSEAISEYRDDMDSVQTFITECLYIDASQKSRLDNKVLYSAYIKWCTQNNEHVMSHKWLSMQLQEKGYTRRISNGTRFWLGLDVRPEWDLS